jgi:CHAT domain-containing protein/tetratricopeptide (TPR) repeat protein
MGRVPGWWPIIGLWPPGLWLAGALVVGACDSLPPEALVSHTVERTEAPIQVGANQVGEPCQYRSSSLDGIGVPATRAYKLRCGSWQQPSGRIFKATEPRLGIEPLSALATASSWRTYLNQRFICALPTPTQVLGNADAVLMQCVRRNGGWPHLALAATIDGQTFMADGVLSTLPALEATLASLTGRTVATASDQRHGQRSDARELLAARLSGQPFGSGDLDRYFSLMRLGDENNAVDNFSAAEDAFREALAVQQRILGPNNPGLAMPLIHLGLQISNQKRFVEAEGFFNRATVLLSEAPDPLIKARFEYYLALHAVNQGKRIEAADIAHQAELEYGAYVPASLRDAARRGAAATTRRSIGQASFADALILDPETQAGVMGIAAIWRLRASLAYFDGQYDDAQLLTKQARELMEAAGINPPGMLPRTVRLAALTLAKRGDAATASDQLGESARLFDQIGPNERPVAVTLFLAGREALQHQDADLALRRFRDGAKILRDRRLGLPEALVMPYVEALYRMAEQTGRNTAEARALHAEMFEASQLIQGGLTTEFIAKAAARLAAGDQTVSAALRQLQQIDLDLKKLFVDRDIEAQKPGTIQDQAELTRLDEAIANAGAKRAEAESEAQAAAPSYGQLVQALAPADKVAGLLRPGEALLSIALGAKFSFGFLVKTDGVTAYRIDLGTERAADISAKLRQSAQIQYYDTGEPYIPDFDVGLAHVLYGTLFGPIAGSLEGVSELVVAPAGPLLSLPFEMLVTAPTAPVEDDDYRRVPFLLKTLALSYVPAPQTFVGLRQIKTASAAPRPFIGFGDFRPASTRQLAESFPANRCQEDLDFLGGLGQLPGTRAEVVGIGNLLGAAPDEVLLGDQFTKERLFKLDLRRYRIVQLATHAFLPTELRCKSEPSILLSVAVDAPNADAAFLEANEILKLQMDADLVVLSACNTAGPGGHSAGESLSGLARAFFFAGTRGLMVTHWSVEDESARFLTTRTVRAMQQGEQQQETVTALRRAKLELIERVGTPGGMALRYSHPFAWAPFVLIGDGLRLRPPGA